MRLRIDQTLHCTPRAYIDLPINSWSEVKEWYVKWDTLHYTLDGKEWKELELGSDSTDCVEWKHPVSVAITAIDENDDEELVDEA